MIYDYFVTKSMICAGWAYR